MLETWWGLIKQVVIVVLVANTGGQVQHSADERGRDQRGGPDAGRDQEEDF